MTVTTDRAALQMRLRQGAFFEKLQPTSKLDATGKDFKSPKFSENPAKLPRVAYKVIVTLESSFSKVYSNRRSNPLVPTRTPRAT